MKREEQGHVYLTKLEKARLAQRAANRGMTQSAYLRFLVLNDIGVVGENKKESA